MEMTIKIKELVKMEQAAKSLCNMELPFKLAFKVSRTLKIIQTEIETFNETKTNIFKKYGTHKAETDRIELKPENIKIAMEEIDDVFNTEITINVEKLKFDDFNLEQPIKPAILIDLEPIFE